MSETYKIGEKIRLTFAGAELIAAPVIDPELGDRVNVEVRFPSRERRSLKISPGWGGEAVDGSWHESRLSAEDAALADALAPFQTTTPQGTPHKPIRCAHPDLVKLIEAAFPGLSHESRRQPRVSALAEMEAATGAEGTPPDGRGRRPDRTCVECGSPVYGEHCTHCMES
jgi:hypothetical protein